MGVRIPNMFQSNIGISGSRLEVRSRGKFQTSGTYVELKLNIENPKLCSHKAQFLARLDLVQLPKFSHVHTQLLTCIMVQSYLVGQWFALQMVGTFLGAILYS